MRSVKGVLYILIGALCTPQLSLADKNIEQLPSFYDEFITEKILEPQSENYFYQDATYEKFLLNLATRQTPSIRSVRVLKLAIERIYIMSEQSRFVTIRNNHLNEMRKLIVAGMKYTEKNHDEVLQRYLEKWDHAELLMRYQSKTRAQIERAKQEEELAQIQLEEELRKNLRNKIFDYLNKVEREGKTTPEIISFKATELEVAFKEVISNNINGVSYIVPKDSRKKLFSVKVLTPSSDSIEAVSIAKSILAPSCASLFQ